jgi:CHAT domain-containing protein
MKRCTIFVFLLGMLSFFDSGAQTWKDYSDSGTYYNSKNDFPNAIRLYGLARAWLSKDSLHTDSYIQTCTLLGTLYARSSEFEKAEPLFLESKNTAEQLHGKDASYAQACTFLGNVYTDLGQYAKAKSYFFEAKDIREKIFTKESKEYAQTCNSLANLYWNLGLYEKAEPLAAEALGIRGRVMSKEDAAYAISCTNLANIYRDMKQYAKAEPLYIQAKNIREKVNTKQSRDYAASCNILADLYYFSEQYEKAEPLYIEAKNIREALFTNESLPYAESCNNLAAFYSATGQYEKAEPLFWEAKKIWDKKPGNANSPINASGLAYLYFEKGDYKKSDSFYTSAREQWEKNLGVKHPYYIENTGNLAKVYWNTGQLKKADSYFSASFNGQYELIRDFFQFTSETEKENYLRNLAMSQDELLSFYFLTANHQKAAEPFTISLLNRNLILSSNEQLVHSMNQTTDTVFTQQYQKWLSLKQDIARLYAKGVSSTSADLTALSDSADGIEKKLSSFSSGFKTSQDRQNISWKDIQKGLKKNEAAIEFAEFRLYDRKRWTDTSYYIALVLRKDLSQPVMVPLFEKKRLDSILKMASSTSGLYTRGIEVESSVQPSSLLYQLIWKPIEKQLKGISNIYFAPAGLLHQVAFTALKNGDHYLGDQYQLVQLNTTASVVGQQPFFLSPADRIVLFGGIDYNADPSSISQPVLSANVRNNQRSLPDDLKGNETWQELPGTKNEIEEINKEAASGYQLALYSGLNATEEAFKSLNGNASPAVVHIASHGFFFPDPAKEIKGKGNENGRAFRQSDNPLYRSGLLFAGANRSWTGKQQGNGEDGILTAYEASHVYLPHTKLVVLSACETALGEIQGSEGVYGLQRAFKMAGVENLVMSLWKVPDAETAEFMQVFYKNMFNNKSVSDAFYHAQTAMKNKYRDDPYKWAAWVLVR